MRYKNHRSTEILIQRIHSSFSHNSPKQPRYPSIGECINTQWYIHPMKCLTAKWSTVDESQKHCVSKSSQTQRSIYSMVLYLQISKISKTISMEGKKSDWWLLLLEWEKDWLGRNVGHFGMMWMSYQEVQVTQVDALVKTYWMVHWNFIYFTV